MGSVWIGAHIPWFPNGWCRCVRAPFQANVLTVSFWPSTAYSLRKSSYEIFYAYLPWYRYLRHETVFIMNGRESAGMDDEALLHVCVRCAYYSCARVVHMLAHNEWMDRIFAQIQIYTQKINFHPFALMTGWPFSPFSRAAQPREIYFPFLRMR